MDSNSEFYGKLVWGLHADFERDRPHPRGEMFRLWEELSTDEQKLYIHIGNALLNFFRNTEGTASLREQLQNVSQQYEQSRQAFIQQWKKTGGR